MKLALGEWLFFYCIVMRLGLDSQAIIWENLIILHITKPVWQKYYNDM